MTLNKETDKQTTQNDIPKYNFKKYLINSELDYKWGFIVKDSGYTHFPKEEEYPRRGHPGKYMFTWESGRVLDEYHLVVISEGKGIFESSTAGLQKIHAGDGFIIFPGEWHRYKPSKKTGWTEQWVGFSGEMADAFMKEYFFKKEQPIANKFNNQLVLKHFKTLQQLIEEEPYGFQRTASGICIQLMTEFCNTQHGSELKHASPVSRAKHIMNEKIDEEIDFTILAKNLGISYSKFRSDFKRQTGLAPLQYFLLLKIEKAKELLISSQFSAKEISSILGFQTDHYFNRIFKQKTGFTPKSYKIEHQKI